MVPDHEPADHTRPATCAVLTRIRILNVDWMGNEFEPDPQGNTLPTVFPRYTAPARARVVLNLSLPKWPTSRTAQGPVAHLGPNRHDSSQLWLLGMPRRSEAPWTILTPTVHRPSRRAADTGGREVATTRTEDRAERLPPRTAATRNWYAVAGARPVPRYDVTVPGTEPITCRRSGSGTCRVADRSAGPPSGTRLSWCLRSPRRARPAAAAEGSAMEPRSLDRRSGR
jgi:hypothetical protein